MPKLDFDIVTLGHGSGGLLSQRLLDKVIYPALDGCLLGQTHDAAILSGGSEIVMTTDSFVVSPISFPGGNIGDLAVHGTINDLAVAGARPQYLSLALIIEEGLSVNELWDVLVSIRFACIKADVKVVTGDTKVVDKGSGDKLFINTTGIGQLISKHKFDGDRLEDGNVVIVSGPLASHGMAIMSVRENLSFESSIESDTQSVFPLIEALISKFGDALKFFRDPTRGGLGTVLTELTESKRFGIELEATALPVLPQVKSACELLGLDPIYVANEGIFVCVVSKEIAEDVVDTLVKLEAGAGSCIIGKVVMDHPGKVIIKSFFGGRRVVNRLVGEQLPRIC